MLSNFIQFGIDLYRGCAFYVPPMIQDVINELDPKKNPAFEFCDTRFWMLYDNGDYIDDTTYNGKNISGKPVGRIMGIINHRADHKTVRFAYCDFIDDHKVSHRLLDLVAQWGKEHGCTRMEGPLGMTEMDQEGCLIRGFDQMATMVDLYNYPYYQEHFRAYGMTPSAIWVGYRMRIPDQVPEKHQRIAEWALKRYELKVLKILDPKVIVPRYGRKIFELMNRAYAPLHAFVPLTDKQIDYFIKRYLPQVRLDLVRLIVDSNDDVVAFGICCPSLSKAQQRARGRMWPFGWIHLAKAMYTRRGKQWWRRHLGTDTVDLLLMAVDPKYQGFGVNAALFTELIPQFLSNGYTWVETNNELMDNHKVRNMWSPFPDLRQHKERCTFELTINC